MDLAIAILALIATAVAAVAAVGSWRAAQKANTTARIMANIETQRHHGELSPHFEVRADPISDKGRELDIWLKLVGPTGIDRLDEVTATVVADHTVGNFPGPGRIPPSAATREAIARQVWGPFKFVRVSTVPMQVAGRPRNSTISTLLSACFKW
jgi:hypothetical protein